MDDFAWDCCRRHHTAQDECQDPAGIPISKSAHALAMQQDYPRWHSFNLLPPVLQSLTTVSHELAPEQRAGSTAGAALQQDTGENAHWPVNWRSAGSHFSSQYKVEQGKTITSSGCHSLWQAHVTKQGMTQNQDGFTSPKESKHQVQNVTVKF